MLSGVVRCACVVASLALFIIPQRGLADPSARQRDPAWQIPQIPNEAVHIICPRVAPGLECHLGIILEDGRFFICETTNPPMTGATVDVVVTTPGRTPRAHPVLLKRAGELALIAGNGAIGPIADPMIIGISTLAYIEKHAPALGIRQGHDPQ